MDNVMMDLTGTSDRRTRPPKSTVAQSILQLIFMLSAGTFLVAAIPAAAATTAHPVTTSPMTVASPAMSPPATGGTRDKTGFDVNDPLFRRLVLGINFSRQLVFNYYYVLLATIAIFTAVNLWAKSRHWLRQNFEARCNDVDPSCSISSKTLRFRFKRTCSSSASSATLCDLGGPAGEHTPLLKVVGSVASNRSLTLRFWHLVHSWMIYQPAPLPFFNRTLPTNSVTCLVLLYLSINIFFLLYNIEFSVPLLFVLADRAGVLFSTNLPLLYVLSAKNQPLLPLTGYSYAALNIFHRRLGEWMCFLGLLHGGSMFVVWATILRPNDYSFSSFIGDRVTILGLCTLACYQLIFFTSLSTARRLAYELFLACHIFLQIGALSFLYFHHSKSRPYVLASATVWAVDRFIYRLLAKSQSHTAELQVTQDGETVAVSVNLGPTRPNRLRKLVGASTVANGWQALDHVFLTVPSMGLRYAFQGHPFTIASHTVDNGQGSDARLDLIIRAQEGFTHALLLHTLSHRSTSIRLDGPYGAHSALRLLQGAGTRILIAGGSGIAVTWPLAQALIHEEKLRQSRDIEMAGLSRVSRPIIFLWVVRKAEQYSWIVNSQLAWLKGIDGVNVVLPPPTEVSGKPDLAKLLHGWVQDCSGNGSVGVVCSGPDTMAREVRNQCSKLVKSGKSISVEIEKYGW